MPELRTSTTQPMNTEEMADALACREVCICAAIRMPDGEVIRGHRHNFCYDVVRARPNAVENRENIVRAEQGFVTSRNRFVDREEGMRLQKTAGAKSAMYGELKGDGLFSEDLY